MRRAETLWLCLLPLLLFAAGAARASVSGERDVAIISFDPVSDQLSATHRCTLDIIYDGTLVSAGLRGYHLEITFDNTYVYVDSLDVYVTEGSFLSDVGGTAFYVLPVDENTFIVDCAILGATAGAMGVGDLCSITFKGRTGDGTSVVEFLEVKLRDPDNRWIMVSAAFGVLILDNTPPDTEAGPVDPYYDTMSFEVPFTASDASSGVRYVELYYQWDGGGYVQYGSTFMVSPIAFVAPGEGVYEFYTIGTDNVDNVEDAPAAADCTTTVGPGTGIDDGMQDIAGPVLRCYPNPFSQQTSLEFRSCGAAGAVDVAVHDLTGRVVARPAVVGSGSGLNSGLWHGTACDGRALPGGVYFVVASGPTGQARARVTLVR